MKAVFSLKLNPPRLPTSPAGFTLVEAAFVFILIGILIGGIFSGKEMIRTSKLKQSYALVQKTKLAMNEFIATYHALPGDMRNINKLAFSGCPAGNGNEVLEPLTDVTSAAPLNDETTFFWHHLSCADLLTNAVAPGQAASATWGESHPRAYPAGGFVIISSNGLDSYNEIDAGIYARWQDTLGGAPDNVLTPADASYLDLKYDDSDPLRGFMRSRGTNCARAGNPNAYDESNNATIECYSYFRLRETPAL